MSHTPPIRRIYIQDIIDSEGKVDAERLLYPVNLFMESTYSLFDGDIRFDENVATQITELTFTTSSTYFSAGDFTPISFVSKLNDRAKGVLLLKIQEKDNPSTIIKDPVNIQWEQVTNNIKINFVTGLDDSTSYNITVMVV